MEQEKKRLFQVTPPFGIVGKNKPKVFKRIDGKRMVMINIDKDIQEELKVLLQKMLPV